MALTDQERQELAALRAKRDSVSDEPGWGEKARATAYGVATGALGGMGELEKGLMGLSEYVVPRQPGEMPVEQQRMWFPTQKEAEQTLAKIGIQKPREEVSGYQTTGEILGGFGTSLPGLLKTVGRKFLGVGTDVTEALAKKAESLGYKLSPAQVKRATPVAQKGAVGFAEHNQNLSNKLASKGTGVETQLVSKDFIADRIRQLGNEFNALYKGKQFNIDADALNSIRQIAEAESAYPSAAGVSAVKQIANQIVDANRSLMRGATGDTKFFITGEGLQRLRNALTERARSTGRADAHEIYNLVDQIDASIARNHPEIASKLQELRPKYRNSVVLEDLYRAGGIKGGDVDIQRLGEMLRGKRGAVRSAGQDIDELGEIGRELNMVPMGRKAGMEADTDKVLGSLLGKGYDILAVPARTRGARWVQRYATGKPESGILPGTLTGTVMRQFGSEEE